MKLVQRAPQTAPGTRRIATMAALLFAMGAMGTWGGCGDAGGIVTITGGSGAGGASSSTSTTVTTSASSTTSVTTSASTTSAGGGGGADCGPGVDLCGATCVNLTNDRAHCGACGEACPTGEICVDSQCGLECVGGSTECGELCVDLDFDPLNCGKCDEACPVGEVCSQGACSTSCAGGTTECVDGCKDLDSDPLNCGLCGLACAAGETCAAGECLARPAVTATKPADAAVGVPINRVLEATFSVPMDAATIDATTFTVAQGANPIAGTVTYSGSTAKFEPTDDYPVSAVLTATITTGAQDTLGQGLAADHVWSFETGTQRAQAQVNLGEASTYAILAFNTVTNVNNPGTVVTGDLGISPGAALVGFPPGIVIGELHLGDPPAATAKLAVLAAYNDAAGRLGAAVLPADLSGLTFTPGLYKNATSVMLSVGNVTLDAQGDSEAVFIFQMGTTLDTNPDTEVILSGGARAGNIYWAVGTSATLGVNAKFAGTVMAASAITMNTGGSMDGRLLAQGAAIALDTNVITVPSP